MIAVSSSSRSFAALGRYLVVGRDKVEEGRVAWTSARNLPTNDPELAAKIMRATASQNVRVSQPVYHLSLSFDPRDVVDRAAMERVADSVLRELKLDGHQAIIVAHADRAHSHMHVLVNRVHPETGLVWDRWQDYPTIQRVLRREEQELGLRPVAPSLDSLRGPGAEERLSGVAADLAAYDRVNEAAEQRYTAEREVSALEARAAQFDTALRREAQGQAAFDDRLGRAFRDPTEARDLFLQTADREGEREAARRMRTSPESYGELNVTKERRGIIGRVDVTDGSARDAAREAASYGTDVVAARRELANLSRIHAEAVRASLTRCDAAGARAHLGEQLEVAKDRARALGGAENGISAQHQLEHRLKQALRRLSPPEFEQLRATLSPHRLTLARKLREMIRDAALGRDDDS